MAAERDRRCWQAGSSAADSVEVRQSRVLCCAARSHLQRAVAQPRAPCTPCEQCWLPSARKPSASAKPQRGSPSPARAAFAAASLRCRRGLRSSFRHQQGRQPSNCGEEFCWVSAPLPQRRFGRPSGTSAALVSDQSSAIVPPTPPVLQPPSPPAAARTAGPAGPFQHPRAQALRQGQQRAHSTQQQCSANPRPALARNAVAACSAGRRPRPLRTPRLAEPREPWHRVCRHAQPRLAGEAGAEAWRGLGAACGLLGCAALPLLPCSCSPCMRPACRAVLPAGGPPAAGGRGEAPRWWGGGQGRVPSSAAGGAAAGGRAAAPLRTCRHRRHVPIALPPSRPLPPLPALQWSRPCGGVTASTTWTAASRTPTSTRHAQVAAAGAAPGPARRPPQQQRQAWLLRASPGATATHLRASHVHVQDAPLPIGYHETISAPHMHGKLLARQAAGYRSPSAAPLPTRVAQACVRSSACSHVPGAAAGAPDAGGARAGRGLGCVLLPPPRRWTACACGLLCCTCAVNLLACAPACAGSGYLSAAIGLMVGNEGEWQGPLQLQVKLPCGMPACGRVATRRSVDQPCCRPAGAHLAAPALPPCAVAWQAR